MKHPAVDPDLVDVLFWFGLVDEETVANNERQWDRDGEWWNWRYFMSALAWKNLPLRKRLFTDYLNWRLKWVRASREWR